MNEWLALRITRGVGTMACAYAFALIAALALPQAIHDTFAGDHVQALPLVTWTSQAFLQLTLLAIILKGQEIQGRTTEARDLEQYNAVMEMLADIREDHRNSKVLVAEVHRILSDVECDAARNHDRGA